MFAMAMLGGSLAGLLRDPMRAIGLWGPVVFVLPFLVFGRLAKWEKGLALDVKVRRLGVGLLIGGSLLLALALWRYERAMEVRYAPTAVAGPALDWPPEEAPRRRGPRR